MIRFKLGAEISINKKVLLTLDSPCNIHFWWSMSKRILFIGDALEHTPEAIKVNKCYYESRNSFKIYKKQFIKTIMSITGWRNNMVYVTAGEYISDMNMVAFKIDDAEELCIDRDSINA